MIILTELPMDIYYIINNLLYSYDNNLIFVNKSLHNNQEFIKCYYGILKKRLFKLKQMYSCIKIQSFIKKYLYSPPFFSIHFRNIFNYPEYIITDNSYMSINSFYYNTMIHIPPIYEIENKNKKKSNKITKQIYYKNMKKK
mgnify:FL=1